MYLHVLLLALLCAKSCYGEWWGHVHNHNHTSGYHMSGYGHGHLHGHGWHHWHSHDRQFYKLASSVIETDQYSKSSCKTYSNCNTQEILDFMEYKLVYTIQGSDSDQIVVQIKHRVIYMNARKLNSEDTDNYYDVRMLPKMLKSIDATWSYDGERLTVVIPYDVMKKYTLKAEETCAEVDENVITVPRAPRIQYKYGQRN